MSAPFEDHQYYMQMALLAAEKAFQNDEVPIGCVIVKNQQIIATTYNRVEALQDATAHAEMLCLRQASQLLQNWRLLDTTVYCTLEPCAMCAGAMLLARVKTLVWAAPDLRHGANGSWIDLFQYKHPCHQLHIISGICQEQSTHLLRTFFRSRRNSKRNLS